MKISDYTPYALDLQSDKTAYVVDPALQFLDDHSALSWYAAPLLEAGTNVLNDYTKNTIINRILDFNYKPYYMFTSFFEKYSRVNFNNSIGEAITQEDSLIFNKMLTNVNKLLYKQCVLKEYLMREAVSFIQKNLHYMIVTATRQRPSVMLVIIFRRPISRHRKKLEITLDIRKHKTENVIVYNCSEWHIVEELAKIKALKKYFNFCSIIQILIQNIRRNTNEIKTDVLEITRGVWHNSPDDGSWTRDWDSKFFKEACLDAEEKIETTERLIELMTNELKDIFADVKNGHIQNR